MSILDTIYSLQTDVLTVTRRQTGSYVDGIYVPSATTTTFTVDAIVQPATGMQRVVGGRDMREYTFNQVTSDVRMVYSETELFPRSDTHDPDYVTYEGRQWTVVRCEPWEIDDAVFFRTLITKQNLGAA